MPGSCAVVGCKSRFVRGGKHFFRFPKEDQFKQLWVQFTRRGNHFQVKKCSAICEEHFEEEKVISKKMGRLYLLKRTVPTIYYRETKEGIMKVVVEFNANSFQYVGEESFNLMHGVMSTQEEKLIVQDRRQRFKMLKSLCRFCFESQDEKFVAISKLEAYSIDPEEVLLLLGIKTDFNEVFSEIVCEHCFQQIVSLDGFRRRCRKAQEEIIGEMEEFDQKLVNTRNHKIYEPWFKIEEVEEEDQVQGPIEIVEEHLDDNILYVGDEDDETYEEYDAQDFDAYKYEVQGHESKYEIQEVSKELCQLIDKSHEMKVEPIEDIIMQEAFDSQFDNLEEAEEEEDDEEDEFQGMPEPSDKDIYKVTDTEAIIKNPDRNSFALRVYECFFCRLKFAGKKTFKFHECQVKEVKCEVERCDKSFNKLSGYNTHVVKVHGLLKTSKHYCQICRNVVMATENQFKAHCRQCNKESEKKDSDRPIDCEICKKKCPNLKSYTVHKLFHDTRNLIGGNEKNTSALNSKGPVVCELCGKEFTNFQGLRTHRKNVHRIGQPKDVVYQCDICSKMRPTKRSLFNHMRNVHRVREAPCNVCHKVFRTPALLQKHMMYHDETKRIHRCPMCPEKPGWFTNVALKRHQKSHHMGLKEYQCDTEHCDAAFSTNSMLKQHKLNYHSLQPFSNSDC